MKAKVAFYWGGRYLLRPSATAGEGLITLGAVGAVAIGYFLAARLGLALLSKPSDVAVFWPASGIAAGILIISGRRACLPLVIGVVVGTVAANLMSDRSFLTSLLKGFCNAGEAVLTAWLIEQWFGREFAFDDLRRVLGFVAAACIAAAASALGGATTMTLFHTAAPFWDVWRAWFLSDGVGIVVVAPLIIALSQVWREPPSQGEWIEGVVGVTLLASISWYVVCSPSGSWLSFDPDVLSLPPLLWLTARCQPAFGLAGALLTSLAFICATTLGIGHFGNEDVPIMGRVNGAQVVITMVTLYTLVLAGLFTERRRNEAALRSTLRAEKEGKTRLADAMAAGQVMAFEWNVITGLSRRDNATRILGPAQDSTSGSSRNDFLRRVHGEDRERLKTHIRELRPNNPAYALTFRFVRPDGRLAWLEETAQGEFDASGRLLRIKGLTRDITERKLAELALAERNAQLALTGQAALVGSYTYESDLERMAVSEGYAAMHGLPEGTTTTTRSQWRARVYPEDLAQLEALRTQTIAERRSEYNVDYRIVRGGEVRWIEARSIISYNRNGKPQRIVGVNIDVTNRKRTETLLRESEARYRTLYEDNPSMYFTVDPTGTVLSVNKFGAQALGYNDAELVGQSVLEVIHEEDRRAAQQQLALCTRKPSTTVKGEIRKVRRDGSVLWVRETACAVQAPDGRIVVLIVCEDTTERKRAEALLKESKTRLSDALAAGLVVAFEWDARTGRSQRSDNADRIMGFAEGDRFMQQVHPEDRENFRTHMRGLSPDNPSYALTFRFVRPDGRQAWLEETAKGEFDSARKLLRIKGLTRDITERKELEDHKSTLISELDHRVKNVLATVLTVASRTQETSSSMGEFVAALEGRIKSMATTHELLSYRRWQGIPLAELVRHELAPYATTSNASVDGPDVVLSAEAGQTLAMVFHELATNAAKFGALAVRSGCVSVRWNFRRNGHAESWLRIQWQESGGRDVVPPTRSGFGTSVVRELIPYELGGTAALMHHREGVRCQLEIPAHWLISNISEEQRKTI